MKVSMQLAQSVSNVDLLSLPKEDLLQKIGAQLGAVEEVIDWGAKYEGVVVVKVVSCEQHPNADKLHVCRIDDGGVVEHMERGDDNLVQVVCGAPNVHSGMLAVWLPPGVTVPSTLEKDPFVLAAKELRGVVSNGMLASPAELGLNDDHDGILEITAEEVGVDAAKPGVAFKKLFGLDDIIVDCENKMFTHRPDCFGILGVARELAGITHKAFKSPDWYSERPQFKTASDLELDVAVQTELVPRFMAVVLDNVTVKKSPMWLQIALTKVGIRPINNVVDITNYIMHMTGQPLHAYDYEKLVASSNKPTLYARISSSGETLDLLNGKTATLDDKTIVIATDKKVVAVGGVMGGVETEVSNETKRIVLEAATFDMYSIRKTAMKYGLFTDSVTRFTKGQSPLQNDRALAKAMTMVHELCNSTQASNVHDVQTKEVAQAEEVRAKISFINERLGLSLSKAEAEKLLANVECVEGFDAASETRSYLMGVGSIDDKLERIGVKIVEKTKSGHYKLILPEGTESDYEKLVSWEMKPGYWNEYIGSKSVFLFKDKDQRMSRYEVNNDTEHEIVEMCRVFANEYYTSLEAMLQGNPWYTPLLPLKHQALVEANDPDELRIQPPFWRTDLTLPEDIVEEVGRLYAYNRVPVELPIRTSTPVQKDSYVVFAESVRRQLASFGANELLTYSFVHADLLKKSGQNIDDAYKLRNALSPDLQCYRLSLLPSLLEKTYVNMKAGYETFALFEIGVVHNKRAEATDEGVPKEHRRLAFSFYQKGAIQPYYQARKYVESLLASFGLDIKTVVEPIDPKDPLQSPFEEKRSASIVVNETSIGRLGEYKTSVLSAHKLPASTAGFELDLQLVMDLAHGSHKKTYVKLSRFPKVQQDITLEVADKVSHGELLQEIIAATKQQTAEHGYVIAVNSGPIFKAEGSDRQRMTFRIVISHNDRTLTTEETNTLLDEVSRRAVTKLAAVRV